MLDALRHKGFEIRFESHATAILRMDFPTALGEIEAALLNFEIPITEIIGSGGGETKGTQRMRHALNNQGWHKVNFEIKKSILLSDLNNTARPFLVDRASTTHEIDHVKEFNGSFEGNKLVALEIEWNNKDPFFDRDLENFKRLHSEGAISVGVIVTRGITLQSGIPGFVADYAQKKKIESFEDLERLQIGITAKQKKSILGRVTRKKKPVSFQEAWSHKFVNDKYGKATTHWDKLITRIDRGVGHPCPLLLIGLPASIVTFDLDSVIETLEDEGQEDEQI